MVKKIQEIYPSSKVEPETISEYGWRFCEELPARPNNANSLSPLPEASMYLRQLRDVIDETQTIQFASEQGVIEIADFAVAAHPEGIKNSLGFYVLLPPKTIDL